ncbi:hypothetical protein [Hymenobacter tenuis]
MSFQFPKKIQFLTLLALPTLLGACQSLEQKEDSCVTNVLAPVSALSSVKTGTTSTPLEVYYTIPIVNSCGQFVKLEENRQGNNIYLSPLVRYEGCVCAQTKTDYKGTYTFTAAQPGKYVVHFLKADNAVLTDTLTVK